MNRIKQTVTVGLALIGLHGASPAVAGSFDCVGLRFRVADKIIKDVVVFGKVPVGQTATQTVSVENTHKHFSADVASIDVMPNPPFALDAASTCMKGELGPET